MTLETMIQQENEREKDKKKETMEHNQSMIWNRRCKKRYDKTKSIHKKSNKVDQILIENRLQENL